MATPASPVGSGLDTVERLQDLLQQVEVMPAEVHEPNLDASRQTGLLQRPCQSFHLAGLPDAHYFDQFDKLRL